MLSQLARLRASIATPSKYGGFGRRTISTPFNMPSKAGDFEDLTAIIVKNQIERFIVVANYLFNTIIPLRLLKKKMKK